MTNLYAATPADIVTRRTPKVGETVAIKHCVKYASNGDVLGLHRSDTVEVAEITATYLDGTVRTGISDVWKVKPAAGGKVTKGATWETVNPSRPDSRQEK